MGILQLPGTTTLNEAKKALRAVLDKGERCPCCTQMAKTYRRPMTAATARVMIAMYRDHGNEYLHLPQFLRNALPSLATQGGYATLAHYWGLLEEDPARRAGYWHVTNKGAQFIQRQIQVPRYANIFDSRLLRLDGDLVDVVDVLGTKFDYAAIMGFPRP